MRGPAIASPDLVETSPTTLESDSVNRAVSTGLDASLLQAIEHVFQMSMPRHACEGDFVVPRPFLLISRLILLHVMEERQ